MRNRRLLLAFTVAGGLAALISEDRYGERLDDLETRVVRLENLAGIPTPTQEPLAGEDGADGQDGEDGQDGNVSVSSGSSSSSSSQSSNTNNAYSASYSSNGDQAREFEISNAGTYHLTAHASAGGFSARIETSDGDMVEGFSVEVDDAGTVSVSAQLTPGEYVLLVESASQWTVIITSMGD